MSDWTFGSMVWHPDVGGLCPHDSTVRWGRCGPELPGEQLVIDAKPAVLLLGVGALDRQEAFDEELRSPCGPSPIPRAGAGDVAVRVDARARAVRPRARRRSCGARADPAAVLLVVRAGLGVPQDGAR
jgi:hypothetical protein